MNDDILPAEIITEIKSWEKGELIAPVTIDLALTTTCNAHCQFLRF